MRLISTTFGCVAAALLATTPASAQDLGSGFILSSGATIVSDYRYRGISQSNRRVALQGSLGVGHESGFYASVWGSSIDDYVAFGSDTELDLTLGYKKSWGSTTLDGGIVYYYYPGGGGADTDFIETYLSIAHAFGPVTAKASAAYAPRQSALTVGNGREDNLYVAGDLGYAIPGSPVSLSAHIGHSLGPSYLTIGDEYTDWSLGGSVTHKNLTAGLSYVDADKNAFSPSGRNIAKGGVVASLGIAF